ncbi:hypothetical protein PIB30_010827 [Stylosanthes scabra]|uniref:NADH dehydrogenase subunit 5 n=1 Tax=Stylosanthes scabra TaxID=79078 RepID=A0ABU6Q5S4_9FABA|nr:hypothetical protein [Stylosanthes scabra]
MLASMHVHTSIQPNTAVSKYSKVIWDWIHHSFMVEFSTLQLSSTTTTTTTAFCTFKNTQKDDSIYCEKAVMFVYIIIYAYTVSIMLFSVPVMKNFWLPILFVVHRFLDPISQTNF